MLGFLSCGSQLMAYSSDPFFIERETIAELNDMDKTTALSLLSSSSQLMAYSSDPFFIERETIGELNDINRTTVLGFVSSARLSKLRLTAHAIL